MENFCWILVDRKISGMGKKIGEKSGGKENKHPQKRVLEAFYRINDGKIDRSVFRKHNPIYMSMSRNLRISENTIRECIFDMQPTIALPMLK